MFRLLLPVLLTGVLGSAAFAADQDKNRQDRDDPPLPGELVLPVDAERNDRGEKQCMTVCARWGEECILINKGAGGMERKCRRTCQQFAEECF